MGLGAGGRRDARRQRREAEPASSSFKLLGRFGLVWLIHLYYATLSVADVQSSYAFCRILAYCYFVQLQLPLVSNYPEELWAHFIPFIMLSHSNQ